MRGTRGEVDGTMSIDAAPVNIAQLLLDPGTTVAVVGATDNRAKYGSIIYRDLKRKGYSVYPVNPHRDTVDGDRAYPDLRSLPVRPTIVNIVVPPDQTLEVLREAIELGLTDVWIQPGAADAGVRRMASEHCLGALIDACIMVQSRRLPSR